MRKQAVQVQMVRVEEGISYSEALKKVGKKNEVGSSWVPLPEQKMKSKPEEKIKDHRQSVICVFYGRSCQLFCSN